jgi:hypothetical protein
MSVADGYMLLLLLALQSIMGFSLLSDFLPFRPFFALMDTYTVEKYQQNLHEICPPSQKYSKQHVTFQKKNASLFK